MIAYPSPAGAQESETTPKAAAAAALPGWSCGPAPPTLLGITPGYSMCTVWILLLNEDVWISCTGKERLILQFGIK